MSRSRLTIAFALAACSALATSSGWAAPLSFVSAAALAPAASPQPVSTPVMNPGFSPQSAAATSLLANTLSAGSGYAQGNAQSLSAPVQPGSAYLLTGSASLTPIYGGQFSGSNVSAGSLFMSSLGGLTTQINGAGVGFAGQQSLTSSYLLGGMQLAAGTLGRWEDYALAELMPRIDLNLDLPSQQLEPSPINESLLLPGFARLWELDKARYLTFGVEHQRVSEGPVMGAGTPLLRGFDSALNLERRFVTAGLSQSLGERNTLGIAAVTAYQHFATYSAGSNTVTGIGDSANYGGRETSVGTGIRVGLASELTDGVSVGATYQSRIDLDTFNSYRGVYSDPADFDVPASAGVGIALQASSNSAITFDVQRVLYSDINAFTSSLMPDRFLSLLGDGSSPNFSWEDLTVFSLGYQWQTSEDMSWHVNYSTRQQPLPTDDQLAQALTPGFADNNVRVGFTKWIGRSSRLNFAASYIPDNIYSGNAGGSELDQVEIEAFWVWDF